MFCLAVATDITVEMREGPSVYTAIGTNIESGAEGLAGGGPWVISNTIRLIKNGSPSDAPKELFS
ncbi:hypothetical protein CGL51_07400 [Pyrobaculum aerophilum]|uniref:Uncharacterized protein n=1 Tax=Pyrobaculum aerophilum TaxID=13773 RepID=A0A371QY16_9CREN|nr:hypothetical protein CGL51_07400 [Pyrobaculum aerophilum]RFA99151.1 hypothetical protein CGL52_04700 [Pyrobaculum aerophilum]